MRTSFGGAGGGFTTFTPTGTLVGRTSSLVSGSGSRSSSRSSSSSSSSAAEAVESEDVVGAAAAAGRRVKGV